MPTRIQRRRTLGWRKPADAVYVGRGSKWGNPCTQIRMPALDGSEWEHETRLLTPADRRGLTPLFWSHVRPYGEVNLDMGARLNLTAVTVPGPRTPPDEAEPSPVGQSGGGAASPRATLE